MRLVVHQVLKDARLLKWILPLWVLLNVSLQLLVLIAVRQPLEDPSAHNLAVVVYSTLRALLVAGFVAIPVLALQHDPGVGTTAFWFTRPIPVRVLLGAKFLLVVPAVVLLPVLLDGCALWIAGVPPAATVRPLLEALALQVVWLLPVMAMAACTTDLAQFVLGVVLEVLTFIAVVTVVSWFLARGPGDRLFSEQTMPVFLVAVVAASFAVLVLAYLSRNLRRSAFAAGSAPVVIGILLLVWPAGNRPAFGPRIASPMQIRPGAVWMTPPKPYEDCEVSAALDLVGIPPAQAVDLAAYQGSLQYASTRLEMTKVYLTARPGQGTRDALSHAASGQPGRSPAIAPGNRSYSFAGTVPAFACRDLAGERGTLHIGFRLAVVEYRAVATLPLSAGVTGRIPSGSSRVLEVSRSSSGVTVRIRDTGLYARFESGVWTVLRGPHPEDVALPTKSDVVGASLSPMVVPVPQHLVSTWWTYDFRTPDWISDARIVLVESRPRGFAEKHVDIPNVVFSALPQQPPR